MSESGYVSIKVFADIYGCSVRYAQQLVREGKAPDHYRMGRNVRFTKESIDRWMEKRFVKCDGK